MPRRPIMSYHRSTVLCISNFLNELLSRLYLSVARGTTYISGIDVIREREQYKNSGRFLKRLRVGVGECSDDVNK